MFCIHRIYHKAECTPFYGGSGCAIHSTFRWIDLCIQVALDFERRVGMVGGVAVPERNPSGLRETRWRSIVKPIGGLNVVLRVIWSRAAGVTGTQGVKKIVRRSILLKHHDDVLELGNLSLCGNHCHAGD